MFLTCVDNRAVTLSDHQRPRGAVENSTYPLTAGRMYPVLGMVLWGNVLSLLVPDDWGGPCYAPAGLFDLGLGNCPRVGLSVYSPASEPRDGTCGPTRTVRLGDTPSSFMIPIMARDLPSRTKGRWKSSTLISRKRRY